MNNTIKKRLELLEKQPAKQATQRKNLDDFYNELHLLDGLYAKGGKV